MSLLRRRGAVVLALAGWLGSARAEAQLSEQNLLLGGGKTQKIQPVVVDPRLPTGAEVASRERPAASEPPACSFGLPVCVQRGAGVPPATALRALAALEHAYARSVLALGLPAPASDGAAGGSPALDLYLLAEGSPVLEVGQDPALLGSWDEASVFCVLGAGAALERSASLCVGEAIARRLDASAHPSLERSYATHLWWTVGQPTDEDAQVIDDLQRQPERGLVHDAPFPLAEGAGILFEYLDTRRSVAGPLVLSTGLLALAGGKSPGDAWQWKNEPDVFDVLRASSGESSSDWARLLGDFSVARAFLGDRDDGRHSSTLGWAGAFGRVRFDWAIPFSSLPRRVASIRPLQPTGSMYVWLELDAVPAGAALGFRARWEPPTTFQWTLVSVSADGRELVRLHAPYPEKGASAELRMEKLEGASGVIVVGTNLGGISVAHPFDPDVAPYEPHACTVYLTKL